MIPVIPMACHDAVARALGLDADAGAYVDADVVDLRLRGLKEDGRARQDRLAVVAPAVDELAFGPAVVCILITRLVRDFFAQLFERPAKQAGAVGDLPADPLGTVLTGRLAVAVRGLFDFILEFRGPRRAGVAPDVAPGLPQRDQDLLNECLRGDDNTTSL